MENTETKLNIETNIDSSAVNQTSMTEDPPVSTPSEGGERPAGRLKLFNKVMERTLIKYMDDARCVECSVCIVQLFIQ